MFHGIDVFGRDAQGDHKLDVAVPALTDTSPAGTEVQMSLAMSVCIEADHTV